MAPRNKFTREQLIETAFEIANSEGFDYITIRNVAKRLGSSIAPIYVNFNDVQELKEEVVQRSIYIQRELMENQNSGNHFLDIGIAAVLFAKRYPLLYDELMNGKNSLFEKQDEIQSYSIAKMKKQKEFSKFDDQTLALLLIKMQAFQMGFSALARFDMYAEELSVERIIQLMKETGNALYNDLLKRQGK